MTTIRTLLAAAAAAAAAALALLVAPAAEAAKHCPAKPGTLAKSSYGRVWHRGASLYACTNVYGHKPRARRMGPYKSGTKVTWDGVNLAWTVPLTREGVRSDRLWAGSADTGKRWLDGKRLLPRSGATPEREARILRLALEDRGVAWVTRGGDVGFALQYPEDDPRPTGQLPAPLQADGKRLLVGSFGAGAAGTLADSLRLGIGEGDGDECGGSNGYNLTFRPAPGAPEIGAQWTGGWVSTNC